MGLEVELTIFARAALAALLGFAIGLEREYRGKSAGDRTFALLALGAAAIVGTGAGLFGPGATSRVIQGVVTGIGFIGGGLIFRSEGGAVRGLTTAAGAWAATGVGILCGAGAYLAAPLVTVLILVILELEAIPVLRRVHERAEAERQQEPPEG